MDPSHIELLAIVGAAFLGPASAMGVGIKWMTKWTGDRFDSVEKKLDLVNGGQRTNTERIAKAEQRISDLPCADPGYRRRMYGQLRDIGD